MTTLTDDALSFGGDVGILPRDFPLGLNAYDEFASARWTGAIRAVSACASFILHLTLIAFASLWISHRSGLIKEDSQAISVEVLHTSVTEQLPAEEISDVTAEAALAVAVPEVPAPEELKEVEELPIAMPSGTSAPDGMDVVQGSDATTETVGKEGEVDAEPNERDEPRRLTDTPEKRQPAKEVDRRKAATPKKTTSAETPSVGAKAKAPRASASSGSVLNYASRVRAKVSGHVPRSGAGKGTVVVSFGVMASGGLGYARIARSSGNSAVDRAVLAGVRSAAPFPSPPAGASPSQLRFSVSFQFR